MDGSGFAAVFAFVLMSIILLIAAYKIPSFRKPLAITLAIILYMIIFAIVEKIIEYKRSHKSKKENRNTR